MAHRVVAFLSLLFALLIATPSLAGDVKAATSNDEWGTFRSKVADILPRMDAIKEQADGIVIKPEYCAGDPTLDGIRSLLADLRAQFDELNSEYNAQVRLLMDQAKARNGAPTGYPIGPGMGPDNPNFYHQWNMERNAARDALVAKENQLKAVKIRDCTPKKIDPPKEDPTTPQTPDPVVQIPDLPTPPPGPNLTPLALPDHFCSEEDKTKYRADVMWPFITAAREQAAAWAHYAYLTSTLRAKYSDDPKMYAAILPIDLAAGRNSRKATDFADDAENNLPARLAKVPVIDCKPPVQEPPPGYTGGPAPEPGGLTTPGTGGVGEPTPLPPLPEVPDCFKTREDQKAFIDRVHKIQDDLRDALIYATGDKRIEIQRRLDEAHTIVLRAENRLMCDTAKDDEPHITIGIGIGLGGGDDHHHRDDEDRDRHRPPPPDHGDRPRD